MKRTFLSGIYILIAAAALSCGRTASVGQDLLPYVSSVLSDTSSVAYQVLDRYDPSDKNGTIAVIGPQSLTRQLTDYLMVCDIYDNIDARSASDSLPDFSGEIFTPYYDIADEPYEAFLEDGDDNALREVTVRNAVAAVADKCYQNTFSREPSVDKLPAKVLIYSSSFSETGIEDVDTLFSAFGKKVSVISPVKSIAMCLADSRPENRIGIWASSEVLASGVYARIFRDWNYGFDYVGFSPEGYATAEEGFFRFLDMYLSTGEVTPLSALVIDDFSLSAEADYIRAVAERVNSSTGDGYAVYRAMLSDDFVVIDAVSAIAKTCYRLMRSENFFTHRIAYPESREYLIVDSSEPEDNVKYIEYNQLYVH